MKNAINTKQILILLAKCLNFFAMLITNCNSYSLLAWDWLSSRGCRWWNIWIWWAWWLKFSQCLRMIIQRSSRRRWTIITWIITLCILLLQLYNSSVEKCKVFRKLMPLVRHIESLALWARDWFLMKKFLQAWLADGMTARN